MQEVAVVCHDEDTSVFLDLRTQATLYKQRHNACAGTNALCYSSAHNVLLTGQRNKDGLHIYWPLKDAPRIHHTSEHLTCLTISNDCVYLAAGSPQGRVFLWHLNSGHLLRMFSAHYRAVTQVHFLDDASFLVTASADSSVKSWSLAEVLDTTQLHATPPSHKVITDHHLSVTDLQGCPRPGWVVTCSLDMTVKVLDVLDGTVLYSRPLLCPLLCLAVNRLATTAFAGGADGTVHAVSFYGGDRGGSWQTGATPTVAPAQGSGDGCPRFEGHTGRITGLAVTLDDRWLVSGAEDGKLNVWDIASAQLLRTILEAKGPITGLRLLVLPRVFPTERSLAALHPLGPTLRKHPLTDFTAYAVAVPAPHLRARLALLEQDKASLKDNKKRALFSDSMVVDAEAEAAEETETLRKEITRLQDENARLLALNNKLFGSLVAP